MPEKVVVWECDGLVHHDLSYGAAVQFALESIGAGVERRAMTTDRRLLPEDLSRLHVISPGDTSVNDRSGWMKEAVTLTQAMLAHAGRGELGLFGIGLGAQMIAEASSPGCVRGRFTAINAGFNEVIWHRQRVYGSLPNFNSEEIDIARFDPRGVYTIASTPGSAGTEVQAFRIGEHIGGVQSHLELGDDHFHRMIEHHAAAVQAHGGDVFSSQASVLFQTSPRALFHEVLDLMGINVPVTLPA